jgi:NinB protein
MRTDYLPKTIRLVGKLQIDTAINAIQNAPIDSDKPLEVIIREEQKGRSLSANALMWAGPLNDIASQAWVHGKQYSALIWHEYFKEKFLPDFPDLTQVKEGYRKYEETPDGRRILIGSTQKLTKHGFSLYMEQIYAYGAELGVRFSETDSQQEV